MTASVDAVRLHALLARSRARHAHSVQAAASADVPALRTAASLENLVVSVYSAALGLPDVQAADPTLPAYLRLTRGQHAQHAAAFNAAAVKAGGKPQTNPEPGQDRAAQQSPPTTLAEVVALAAHLADVAAQTYVRDAEVARDASLRTLYVSVAAVEAQHRSVLAVLGALLGPADRVSAVTLQPDPAVLSGTTGALALPVAETPVTAALAADAGAGP